MQTLWSTPPPPPPLPTMMPTMMTSMMMLMMTLMMMKKAVVAVIALTSAVADVRKGTDAATLLPPQSTRDEGSQHSTQRSQAQSQ